MKLSCKNLTLNMFLVIGMVAFFTMGVVAQNNTNAVAESSIQTDDSSDSLLIIKDNSFAGIRLGMKTNKIPQSVPGIYDKYRSVVSPVSNSRNYLCMKNGMDKEEIEVYDEMENGTIDMICIYVKGAKIADTDIEIGASISEVKNTAGLVKQNDFEYEYNKNFRIVLDLEGEYITEIIIGSMKYS